MFKAEVKPGQSIVTGGYKTPDGRNQFTVLRPQLIRDESGQDSIRIDSKIIDMGAEDIAATGLDSLATNAKNTLQQAEAWEESDVSNTMETLKKSGSSDRMSGPTIMTRPGSEFTIAIGSKETGSYVLKGTATPSPSSSGGCFRRASSNGILLPASERHGRLAVAFIFRKQSRTALESIGVIETALAPVWIHSSKTLFPLAESPPQRPRRKPKRVGPRNEAFQASVMAHLFCYTRPIWRKYPLTMPDQLLFSRSPNHSCASTV